MIRAARWTATPRSSRPAISTSPVWTPTRSWTPKAGPGDVADLAPGHDSWVIGEVSAVLIDLQSANSPSARCGQLGSRRGLAPTTGWRDDRPVEFTTILVAIAGPVGITLGWWLGKRSEHERMAREERKSAYVAFTSAAIQYRNSDDAERRRRRNERWEALSVLTLVAPPAVVQSAAYLVAAGDKLLDPDIGRDERRSIYAEVWEHINRFTQLARTDLRVGENDAFAALTPVTGERISFERPAANPTASQEER
jgi:hypothetical protein